MAAGIPAGTVIYDLPGLKKKKKMVQTEFGEVQIFQGVGQDQDLIFLPRHGIDHDVPPHRVNYRAHIKAFQKLGVNAVLAAYAVGSINTRIPPLSLVVLDDFIDFTSGRKATFFEGGKQGLEHVDMSQPFDPELRKRLLETALSMGMEVRPGGVYVATDGPRLETPAEIAMFQKWGGDVVGMTAVPECVLAKELEIPFAGLAFSVNWAAGIEEMVTLVEEGLEELTRDIIKLFISTLRGIDL